MCGFVVIIQRSGTPDANLAAFMAEALAHRGPDGEGRFVGDGVAMHHKRLAVIDKAGGQQPMAVQDVVGVFNGEIYNYVELRDELRQLGQVFTTQSDTEVLLRAYLQWGEKVVERLDGMFAFVLLDRTRNEVFAARDAFGIKPLYRAQLGDTLVYASEIKAILRHPQSPRGLDRTALEDYLSLQFVLGERTMFEGICKLEPAHAETLARDTGRLRRRRFWTPDYARVTRTGLADVQERVGALLDASIRRQMRSDVPVGAYLSGGLDSSFVAARASRHTPERFETFTGAFHEGPQYDETPYAQAVADHIGARMHTLYPTDADFVDMLPALIYFMDEPAAGPGLFPQFMVSREARRHVTVCLGGQGGDEIFVGYARYLIGALEEALLGAIQGTPMTEHGLTLANVEHCLGTLKNYQPLLRRVWGEGMDAPGFRRYFRIMNRLDATSSLLDPAMREQMANSDVENRFREVFDRPAGASHLKKMLHFDMAVNLPTLLQVEDRASMASSLESRVPLLDTAVVQAVANIPDRMLLAGGFSKAVLRRIATPYLPASVVHRTDKMGFPVPLQQWVKGRARDFVRDVLLSGRARGRGIFSVAEVERLIDNEFEFGRSLWGALQVELWHRTFLDADGVVPRWSASRADPLELVEAPGGTSGKATDAGPLQRQLVASVARHIPCCDTRPMLPADVPPSGASATLLHS
ncbi:MAG: asparagine synthase (glutamine-hydrolyzing) [Burkholderiaceae bacterium]